MLYERGWELGLKKILWFQNIRQIFMFLPTWQNPLFVVCLKLFSDFYLNNAAVIVSESTAFCLKSKKLIPSYFIYYLNLLVKAKELAVLGGNSKTITVVNGYEPLTSWKIRLLCFGGIYILTYSKKFSLKSLGVFLKEKEFNVVL